MCPLACGVSEDNRYKVCEGEFGVGEQAPIGGEISSTGRGGGSKVGMPLSDPDALVVFEGPVAENLRMVEIALKGSGSARGVCAGASCMADDHGVVICSTEQDSPGFGAVAGSLCFVGDGGDDGAGDEDRRGNGFCHRSPHVGQSSRGGGTVRSQRMLPV
jgi:hypothetical protein